MCTLHLVVCRIRWYISNFVPASEFVHKNAYWNVSLFRAPSLLVIPQYGK